MHKIVTCKYGHWLAQCRCIDMNKPEVIDYNIECPYCARDEDMERKRAMENFTPAGHTCVGGPAMTCAACMEIYTTLDTFVSNPWTSPDDSETIDFPPKDA